MLTEPQDAEKWDLGTEVLVRKDDGSDFRTKTRSKPWQLGHGAWVIAVEGIAGGYSLERVRLAAAQSTPAVDWRELLKDSLEVMADETQALETWATTSIRAGRPEDRIALRAEMNERARDLRQRAERLRDLLEITDPTKARS